MQLILVVQSYLFEFKNNIRYIGNIDSGYLIQRDIWYTMIYFIFLFIWNLLAKAILCINGS